MSKSVCLKYIDFILIINYLIPMVRNSVEARNKKKIIIKKCFELFDKFNQIILVGFSNVGSSQVQQIRKLLSKKGGQLVIAKNTLLRKIVQLRSEDRKSVV